MGQFVTLKKSGPKYGPEISRVIVIQMNWNNKDPVFCSLLFSGPYFGPDSFKVPDPKEILGRSDKLE